MIEVKGLSKSYGRRKILSDLSFRLRKGGVTGIVGPNACGKTTLIKCLLGLTIADQGELFLNGEKFDSQGSFRSQMGYMPQAPAYPPHLSLNEVLDMLEQLRGEKAPLRQELVEYFELGEITEQPLEQLSGGTQQKVAAVMAFMFDAPLIILDEPTVGLDPITAVRFKDLVVKKSKQGKTILLVSHIMNEMEQMADEMAFMNEGKIVFFGTTIELLKQTQALQLEQAIIALFAQARLKEKRGEK